MLMKFKMCYLKMYPGNLSKQQNQKVTVTLLLAVFEIGYKIIVRSLDWRGSPFGKLIDMQL